MISFAMRVGRRHVQALLPAGSLLVVVIIALLLPAFGSRAVGTFDIFNTFQGIAGPGLLALAIGLSMIAREFDLSTLGLYAFGGMLAVQLGDGSPLLGVVAAVAAGLVVGVVQGAVIARTKVTSMALTLGTYIAFVGLASVIGGDETVSFTNVDTQLWLDQTIASVVSPRSLVTIAAFAIIAIVMWRTRLGMEIRALGGDRDAARAAGAPVDRLLVLVFAASGALSALGGALTSYSLGAAIPDPGLAPLVFAVTAVLLAGVSLAGGRGSALGIFVACCALGLLQQVFAILGTPGYVADLVQGGLLCVAVAVAAPDLRQLITRTRTRLGTRVGAAT